MSRREEQRAGRDRIGATQSAPQAAAIETADAVIPILGSTRQKDPGRSLRAKRLDGLAVQEIDDGSCADRRQPRRSGELDAVRDRQEHGLGLAMPHDNGSLPCPERSQDARQIPPERADAD